MNFENWIRRFAPYLVGWYAIASVMDAMFFSMTGLTFFVGDQYVRLALTVLDAAGAVVLHRLLAEGDKARTRRSREVYDEAAQAVRAYIASTCTPIDEKGKLLYESGLHNDYMRAVQSATGTMFTDIYSQALAVQMARKAQYAAAQNLSTTVQYQRGEDWTA